MKDIFVLANELGEAIKETEEYKAYEQAKNSYEEDETLQALIGAFNLKKMAVMEEMKKEAQDEKRVAALREEMREAYVKIMACDAMTDFTEKKEALETTVNQIFQIINTHVSGESGCTHDCSTCGGCH